MSDKCEKFSDNSTKMKNEFFQKQTKFFDYRSWSFQFNFMKLAKINK